MTRPTIGLSLLLACWPQPGVAAQGSLAVPSGTVFHVAIDTVPLTVTVTHASRGYVGHLSATDFEVFDNGVRQPITIFEQGSVPLDVVLLIDVSSSVFDRFDLVRTAARGFLATLRPGDRAAIVGFNERLRVLTNWTSDPAQLQRGLEEAYPGGSTALYTALYVALAGLDPQGGVTNTELRRRVVIVLSDGEDTGSLVSYEGVLDACRRTMVAVYTIRVRSRGPSTLGRLLGRRADRTGEFVLSNVSRETGGRAFDIGHIGELSDVYQNIATELANQYLLGYAPPVRDDPRLFHSVTVVVPGHPGAVARTRLGYMRDDRTHPRQTTPD